MNYTMEQYTESAQVIRAKLGAFVPQVALILGSGLGFLGDEVESPIAVDYKDIPILRALPPPATRGGWSSVCWRASGWR